MILPPPDYRNTKKLQNFPLYRVSLYMYVAESVFPPIYTLDIVGKHAFYVLKNITQNSKEVKIASTQIRLYCMCIRKALGMAGTILPNLSF